MASPQEAVLRALFEFSEAARWTALRSSGLWTSAFRTDRVAKLMPNGELQFTIGATELGESANLNETIRSLVRASGIEVLEGRTTAGNKRGSGEYPTVQVSSLSGKQLEVLLYRIEGAIIHVAANALQ